MSFKSVIYLGLRPFKPKKHGIKGVVTHTILVVAIAMLPLVVVLMVADGMIQGITNRYIETSSYHLRVYSRQNNDEYNFAAFNKLKESFTLNDEILSCDIERGGAGVGVFGESRRGLYIRGVAPDILQRDDGLREYLTVIDGSFDISDNQSVVLSSYIARKMDVTVGDDFRIITGKVLSNGRILPKVTKLKVSGIVKTGYEEIDKLWVFVSLDLSKKIIPSDSAEIYLGIKSSDPYGDMEVLKSMIKEQLPSGWIVREWAQLNKNTYENFKTTQMVLALIMGLIVIVAAINISSSLVMLVLEKRRDIAILKSMGLSPGEVMGSYLVTGLIIGIIGTILGLIIGILISLNINSIVKGFEQLINLVFSSVNYIFNLDSISGFILLESEYYLDNIPVELDYLKLLIMTFFSISTTAAASFFPARRAGKIKPLKIMQKF